jgi:hypothetical protein
MLNGGDPTPYVPEGCDDCADEAGVFCQSGGSYNGASSFEPMVETSSDTVIVADTQIKKWEGAFSTEGSTNINTPSAPAGLFPDDASSHNQHVYFLKYCPLTSGKVNVELCGSDFDTYLYFLQQSGTGSVILEENDDYCGASSGIDDISVEAGLTYFIGVAGYYGSTGNYNLNIVGPAGDCGAAPAPALLRATPPPTPAPTQHICSGGSHGCDPMTTYCSYGAWEEDHWNEEGFVCECNWGLIPNPYDSSTCNLPAPTVAPTVNPFTESMEELSKDIANSLDEKGDTHTAEDLSDIANKIESILHPGAPPVTSAHIPANSCSGKCWGGASGCYCDESCSSAGDCCPDFVAVCPDVMGLPTFSPTEMPTGPPTNSLASCAGMCGGGSMGCYCDDACASAGDCCTDYSTQCAGAVSSDPFIAYESVVEPPFDVPPAGWDQGEGSGMGSGKIFPESSFAAPMDGSFIDVGSFMANDYGSNALLMLASADESDDAKTAPKSSSLIAAGPGLMLLAVVGAALIAIARRKAGARAKAIVGTPKPATAATTHV